MKAQRYEIIAYLLTTIKILSLEYKIVYLFLIASIIAAIEIGTGYIILILIATTIVSLTTRSNDKITS